MRDDGQLRLQWIFVSRVTTLGPVTGVVKRVQISGVAKHDGAQPHSDARLIHHMKHAGQALMQGADEVANGARFTTRLEFAFTEIEQTIGRAAIPHFMIDSS